MEVLRVLTEAAVLAHRLTNHLPAKDRDQIRSSASSSALNAAEGLALKGARRRSHLDIAYGSCQEAKTTTAIMAGAEQIDLEGGRRLWRLLHQGGGLLYGCQRKG